MESPTPDSENSDFLIGENRLWPRIQTSIMAIFADTQGYLHEERVSNLSKGGMFIQTKAPLSQKDRLEFILILPDHSCEIAVQGQIRHRRSVKTNSEPKEAIGLGIMFTSVEPSLKTTLGNFIDRLLDTEVGGGGDRLSPRVATPPCKVTISATGRKEGAILTNISKSGMFIRSKTPLNLFEQVQICITHPETYLELELIGEVLHVHKMEDPKLGFGAGLRFVNLDPQTEIAVIELVREIMFRQKITETDSHLPH